MKWALYDVEENGMSIMEASKKCKIPTTMLSKWLGELTKTSKKGSPTILIEEEEHLIVEWYKEMAAVGHGLEIVNIKAGVAKIYENRPKNFNNRFLGKSWWTSFKN